jgi:hypothetical protein
MFMDDDGKNAKGPNLSSPSKQAKGKRPFVAFCLFQFCKRKILISISISLALSINVSIVLITT